MRSRCFVDDAINEVEIMVVIAGNFNVLLSCDWK